MVVPVACMALILSGCGGGTKSMSTMQTDNRLTEAEKSAGVLTPEVMWKMGRIAGSAVSPDGNTVVYAVTYYNMEQDKGYTSLWTIPAAGGQAVRLTDDGGSDGSPAWSADGSRIYFVSDRSGSSQLWAMNPDGTGMKRLSDVQDGIEGFGVAPSGDKVFYVKRTQVKDVNAKDVYPDLDKSKARVYDDLMARHWLYWDEGSYLHIYVADFDGEHLTGDRDIMEGEAWDAPMAPYFDVAEIAWNHAGTQLAYTCKKMTGTEYALSTDSDIYVYDLATGRTENICKDHADRLPAAYTGYDPGTKADVVLPGYEKYPVFSPDDRRIAFRSMRRGGNESDKDRLLVWDTETKTLSDLTAAFDYNAANVVWADNGRLLFIAPIEATHQVCSADLEGNVQVLTQGDHDINAFTLGGGRLVAEMTTISMATELFGVDPATGDLSQLTEVNKEVYDHVKMGQVQKRWVTTTDGKRMLVWVILPPDFDAAKKYPTLLYCQGGPQSVVSQFWSYRWNFQLMAAQGYVVVAPNRRGLPSFGQEWLDQISGDYSGQNIKDYLSAIDDVSREPWSDETRLGCVGASYGGYSVFYLAGHHDGRFKGFISHCGIFDFESMMGETEELFFLMNDYGGAYWDKDNATAMRSYANSPHKSAHRWDTPILIITGELDYRIPYTQSMEAFTAARLRGVPSKLVVFENEGHQVFHPQNSLAWNREFFGWLDKYVKNTQQ